MQTLLDLQKAGLLDSNHDAPSLKRKMQQAVEEHSKADTPYGPLVQKIRLGAKQLAEWEVCHPIAFLWYMTNISAAFRSIMQAITTDGRVLRLVIYMDEMVPGNPFRPEKGRKVMCVYWTFVDWPAWMLTRSFAWPCYSILRSSIIDELEGGVPYFARVLLHSFFPEAGESLETGVLLKNNHGESYLIKAQFSGWLCDLAGHKEVTAWKGWGVMYVASIVVTLIGGRWARVMLAS